MAVELCSIDSGGTWGSWSSLPASGSLAGSPRLSFSRDLPRSGDGDASEGGDRRDVSLLPGSPASSDFDFCVVGADMLCHLEPAAAADVLFSGGKLLPVPIQIPKCIPVVDTSVSVHTSSYSDTHRATGSTSCPASPPPPPASSMSIGVKEERRDKLKECLASPDDDTQSSKPPSPLKPSPFWRFRRSSSLNYSCGNSCENPRTGFVSPPQPPLLSRSKSTGSNPYALHSKYPTRATASTAAGKYRGTKLAPPSSYYQNGSWKMNAYSSSSPPAPAIHHRHRHSNSNGAVRISPIINVPSPYIPKGRCGGGLFGFGYLLCNGGDKTDRRRK